MRITVYLLGIDPCLSIRYEFLSGHHMWIPVSQHMWIPAYLSLTIPCCLSQQENVYYPFNMNPCLSTTSESLSIHHLIPFNPSNVIPVFTYHIITSHPSHVNPFLLITNLSNMNPFYPFHNHCPMSYNTYESLLINHKWIPAYPAHDLHISINCDSLNTVSSYTSHLNLASTSYDHCPSITCESLLIYHKGILDLDSPSLNPCSSSSVSLWLHYLPHVNPSLSFTFESLPLQYMWIHSYPSHVWISAYPSTSRVNPFLIMHIWTLSYMSHVNPCLIFHTCESLPILQMWIPAYPSHVNPCLSFT
jgi:hypothetical protein